MGNHFHLVVETPNANLVAGMRWFMSTYTAPVQSPAQTLRPFVQAGRGWD
jgi:hypothetical protein